MSPHRQLLADYVDSGSEEAFRELVSAYIGLVHGSALRLVDGNSQLAEDVTQMVFTDLARHAKTLSPKIMVGGWLHRRTCHLAATAMRSERRRVVREREACEMNSPNFDEALAGVGPVLDEAINQLAAEDRDAIMLRFFERLNLRDIGAAMGTTEAAAQKRVERALEKLRGLLARRGVVLSATALALAVGSASATAAPAGLAATISAAALTSVPASAGFTLTTLKILTMTKLNTTLVAGAVILIAAGTATTTIVLSRDESYTPPPNAKMQEILNGAEADTLAGRYREAEEEYVWFHDNAVRHEPGLKSLRDSLALIAWSALAEKYPPAKKKLESIRDQALQTVQTEGADAESASEAFLAASTINDGLNGALAEEKNVELFKWLDAHNPPAAQQAFVVAEVDLIAKEEYALCGRYLDADRSYQLILGNYNRIKNLPPYAATQQITDQAKKAFSSESATLVAVLAIDNRKDEAERVASQASKDLGTPEFAALLAEARNGKVPDPPAAP